MLTAEMGWLRKVARISKRQKNKNEDIRTELNQTETLVQEIERRRLQWFGHVKRMDNSRLPAKALETMATGTRTPGRPKKRWIQNIKEDIQKRRSNICQAVECVKERNQWKTFIRTAPSSQPTGEDGRTTRRRAEKFRLHVGTSEPL